MKWLTISDQYPKSWKLFRKWMKDNLKAPWDTESDEIFWNYYDYTEEHIRDRILYDFLDYHDIYCWVEPICDDSSIIYWTSNVNNNNNIFVDYDFYTRVDAENDCFTRSFEILEENL